MKTFLPLAAKITAFFHIIVVVLTVFSTTIGVSFAMTVSKSSDSAAAANAASSSSSLDEVSVNLKRWAGRWNENNLGWHRDDIHPSLKAHGDKILPPPTTTTSSVVNSDQETCAETAAALSYRVFVPLCGKSMDMAYMASLGSVSQVVGLDGIEKALLEFAKENPQLKIITTDIPPKVKNVVEESSSTSSSSQAASSSSSSSYKYFSGKKIQLIKGDFFALDSTDTSGRFEAIYDRASMVAVEPTLRLDYVAVMGRLIQPGGKILLIAIERDDELGPPFSVTRTHVEQLYQRQEWVESVTALEGGRDDTDRFLEGIYLIQAKK